MDDVAATEMTVDLNHDIRQNLVDANYIRAVPSGPLLATSVTGLREPLRLHLNEPVAQAGDVVACYPDATRFVRLVAAQLRVETESVVATAGADSALNIACRAATGSAVVLAPDFPRYRQHAENAGLSVTTVDLPIEETGFPTAAILEEAAKQPGIVILATIGNPTGYRLPPGVVEEFHRISPRTKIVIDEVYRDFADVDYARRAATTPGLISIGSLSKIGAAGLRAGYLIAEPSTLAPLRRFVSPFAVAGPSLRAAEEILRRPTARRAAVLRQQMARERLGRLLCQRGFGTLRLGANWVLVKIGSGAAALAVALRQRGILVHAPEQPALSQWLRVSTPDTRAVDIFVNELDRILESPVTGVDGRLQLRSPYLEAGNWLKAPFILRLPEEVVQIDHFVVAVADELHHREFVSDLQALGATVVEGPGLWPADFCSELTDLPTALRMHFATVELPGGGLVVVAAPHEEDDQLHQFRQLRGPAGVHHVAILVEDIDIAAARWIGDGWNPLSPAPVVDGDLRQWFLQNPFGQIIELIARPAPGSKTFTCANLKQLRMSEVNR
jgi:histidinol-phosphate/aromatic aminotransferase/cobyric acid decarboxylase-like protein